MQPIVSPFTIYIIEHLHNAFCGLAVFSFVIGVLSVMAYAISSDNSSGRKRDREYMSKEDFLAEEDEAISFRKSLKRVIYLCLFIIVVNIFIPTRDTMYKMLVASYITPDNLDLGVNFTKETFEYFLNQIVEAINKVK